MKKQKGITLIALVVTIIVLLILAGVSLNLISGSNGILGRATTAVNQTKQAAEEERRELARAEALMNYENETYTDKSGKKAIIPAGFAPTGVDGETEIDDGLVITDEKGNEFVWVPVVNEAVYVKTAGLNNWHMTTSGGTGSIEDMVKGDILGLDSIVGISVSSGLVEYSASDNSTIPEKDAVVKETTGGFWVSRYEAGSNSKTDSTIIDWATEEIVSKRGVQPVRYIAQEVALARANNWLSNSNVQSGLITGTQWDLMCQFIGWDIAESDCTNWGNYGNTVGTSYTGYHSPDTNDNEGNCAWFEETEAKVKKGDYTNKWVFPTGTFVTERRKATVQKNIYDIAGNVWEWTTEVPKYSTNNSVVRGCSVDDGRTYVTAVSRSGNRNSSNSKVWHIGFRMVLYVK